MNIFRCHGIEIVENIDLSARGNGNECLFRILFILTILIVLSKITQDIE